ncbi:MAG TPA: glycosyltransferase [Candidatus Acidoferrum sp.]|jgi:glycosyltransferase involved in cell wall biosynthesis|nr:glycosyltransferase [Candidatus Acidoferrum sp.]
MFSISVIICSHNPREDYLRRVLDALRAQTLSAKDWELLLVDNASKESLAERFDLSWHPNVRHIHEEKTGLTHARVRGIAESKGNLLVFVDDDNVLRADYLENALKVSANYPFLGALSGSCLPEFEVEPPMELHPFLAGLLIEKLSESFWAKLPAAGQALPAGAGMVVCRTVAAYYREQVLHDPLRQALGRSGNKLSAGEDSDMALCGFALGLGAGRFPELELTHLISARRLTLEYLEGIHEGFGYSGTLIHFIYDPKGQFSPPMWGVPPSVFKSLLLWLVMWVKGKNHVERRIRLALERGCRKALRDWQSLAHR